MRSFLLFFVLLTASAPASAATRGVRVYEKWLIHSEEEAIEWETAGVPDQVLLTREGMEFDLEGHAVFFRPLPDGFHQNVDALRIHLNAPGLEETAVLFLTLDDEGKIVSRMRVVFWIDEDILSAYIPLEPYRADITGAQIIAVSLRGNAPGITFEGIRFLRYTFLEKMTTVLRSFWILEPFTPHSINILIGPVIVSDPKSLGWYEGWHLNGISANAYMLVGLSLLGFGLLFWGVWQRQSKGRIWPDIRIAILKKYFLCIAAVWLLYDARMGVEFMRNVAQDHVQYIAADPTERTFRNLGRFYDFIDFAQEYVADRSIYEVFFPEIWPHFGIIRYETYPSRPNAEEPIADTWVVFDRPDIVVDSEGRLVHEEEPFTDPGRILGEFDEHSFVFREFPDAS